MKNIVSLIILCLSPLLLLASANFQALEIRDLEKLLQEEKTSVFIFDANNASTRKNSGTIPSAKLLSSYNKFDTAKELPASKDSKLVFYCANELCTASHISAQRAYDAGYKNVYVFSGGIEAWIKAKKTVLK